MVKLVKQRDKTQTKRKSINTMAERQTDKRTNRQIGRQTDHSHLVMGLMKPDPFPLMTPIITMIVSCSGYIFLN